MRRYLVAAAMAALTGSVAGCGASGGPGTRVPGAQLWVARFRAGGPSGDSAMAASPAGGKVFVAGQIFGGRATGDDLKTVAYSAATGRKLWAARYSGPGTYQDDPVAMAVSPAGGSVFVTGWTSSTGNATTYFQTVAYNAATGRQLWASRYGNGCDGASAVAVSPGGTTVFVTGLSGAGGDYATVAYSAASGRQRWASRYNGPANRTDSPSSVAVSPGGSMVFVTGGSQGRTGGFAAATVAYGAATGRQLWVRRYPGFAGSDGASSVAVSPGGGQVFVSGGRMGRATRSDFLTVAYRAGAGRQLWASRYSGPAHRNDSATAVAVSPAGSEVFVTGQSQGRTTGYDYATVAYSAATGRQLWARRYPGYNGASAVAVSPAGARVYVTGSGPGSGGPHGGYVTIAYSAATGRQLWASRYNGSGLGQTPAIAVSSGGRRVFVSGLSGSYYVTIAYRG